MLYVETKFSDFCQTSNLTLLPRGDKKTTRRKRTPPKKNSPRRGYEILCVSLL